MISVLSTMAAGAVAVLLSHAQPGGLWIHHTIHSADSLTALAQRFGVTEEEIRGWNRLDEDTKLERGKPLRILARLTPPPQQLQRALLTEPTRWDEAAARLGVEETSLRAWNPRYRGYSTRLPEKAHLSLYKESGVRFYPSPPLEASLPDVERIEGGLSIGRPQIGRLKHGVLLPTSPHYQIQLESESYGSSSTIWHLQRGLLEFRRASGFTGTIRVGSLSQQAGRKLRGHASHQSGRDADIRLPAMEGAPEHGQLYVTQVDWHATWALIDAMVRTGGVQQIFLEENYHRRLRRAALRLGTDPERIEWVLEHVGHARGHRSHIHIRFICAPEETGCRG